MDATTLLRPGLLAGRVVALGGGVALGPPLAALGATTVALTAVDDEQQAAVAVEELLATHGTLHALLHDLRPAFARGGQTGLDAALDTAWIVTRAVANAAFIAGARGGRVVFVAPPPDLRDAAAAGVRAATENLARTLSIEWARHAIGTVAITPGPATGDAELSALAAYLASPAGDYFSGCRLALA